MEDIPLAKQLSDLTPEDNVMDVINTRHSVRAFIDKPIEGDVLKALQDSVAKWGAAKGPLDTKVRYTLIQKNLGSLATFTMISNGNYWIVGIPTPGDFDVEGYGYLTEKIILDATRLGLGTVWLGGTFRKKYYTPEIEDYDSKVDELYAVVPVGYPGTSSSLMSKVVVSMAKPRTRYLWNSLFFKGKFGVPLTEEEAGDYADAFAAVRVAPSAKNQQAWRIILDEEGDKKKFHFYFKNPKGVYTRLDIGIAMAHWDEVVPADKPGKWVKSEPDEAKISPEKKFGYIITWQEE